MEAGVLIVVMAGVVFGAWKHFTNQMDRKARGR